MMLKQTCTALLFISFSNFINAAAITFNTALPVAEDEFVNRELALFKRSGDDPSGMQRNINVNALISVLAYGITSDWAIFTKIPYFNKTLDFSLSGQTVSRKSANFGDPEFFSRMTLMKKNGKGHTFRLAGFAGIKAPIGSDNEHDRFGRLPSPFQISTGAWDVFGGLVTTWQTLDFEIDNQIAYRNNGKANHFEAGEQWTLDSSLQYRLWPSDLASPSKKGMLPTGYLYGVIEVNFLSQKTDKYNNSVDKNSGGNTLFLSPGLQYVTQRWIIEGVIQKPVIQDLNGSALENNYSIRTGFRWNF